jgi:glutathione S-transferase/alpha,alpha-trehalase
MAFAAFSTASSSASPTRSALFIGGGARRGRRCGGGRFSSSFDASAATRRRGRGHAGFGGCFFKRREDDDDDENDDGDGGGFCSFFIGGGDSSSSSTTMRAERRRRHATAKASSSSSSSDVADSSSSNDSSSSDFILYGSQGSRSPLINWYLHEKGIPFELKEPRDVSNPHPFGQVPALRHKGDVELFESGAILLYLADKCGELKDDKAKSNAYSWVLWANASLDPICFKEDANGRVIDTGIKNETKGMRRLDDVLSKREWLSGDEFGVADVAVAAYLLYVPQFFQGVSFKRWPHVAKFMGRCCSRDSYAKAFGPRVQSYLIGELMKDVGN